MTDRHEASESTVLVGSAGSKTRPNTAPSTAEVVQAIEVVSGVSPFATARTRPRWVDLLERYGIVLLFVLTVIFFALLPQSKAHFLTLANIQNVLGNQCVTVVVALAAVFPFLSGKFDLSIGANAGLCSIAGAAAMQNFHSDAAVAALLTIGLGLLVGMSNGALVAYVNLSAIIVTLATAQIIAGLVLAYANGQIIDLHISPFLTNFGSSNWLGIPRVVYVTGVVCLLAWYVMLHTGFGRYISMAGRNPGAARLVGLDVPRLTFLAFSIGGLVAGIAGLMMTSLSGGGNPQSGPDLLFPALTAVFLGATSIRPGEFNVIGTVVAALFLASANSGMEIAGVPAYVENLFEGGALLIAIGIYTSVRRGASGGTILA